MMQSNRRRLSILLAAVAAIGGLSCTNAIAAAPLHQRIDKLLIADGTPVAGRCSDGEYIRRLYLDLVGTIPTAAEAKAFIDDKDPAKRAKLVDKLLADARYPLHLARTFDVMLMERRADKYVGRAEWEKYLLESFRANKPWNVLAAEILGADGTDAKLRAAAKFYLDRGPEVNLLTRDTGRVFFGKDYQCAQCHNHPLIDNYLQADYYGLYSFISRGYLYQDPKQKKKAFFPEKAEGAVSFTSVFTKSSGRTRPKLPDGLQIDEPAVPPAQRYVNKPGAVRPLPKHSRRQALAELVERGENSAFRRNMANRLWAHMLGRGLVHPVDLHHPDNPPSHPQLLELISGEFAAMKFDVRAFLREIALTEVYQRSIDLPADVAKASTTPAQLQADLAKAKAAYQVAEKAVLAVEKQLEPHNKAIGSIHGELSKADAALAGVKKAGAKPIGAYNAAKKKTSNKKAALAAVQAVVAPLDAALKKLPGDQKLRDVSAIFATKVKKLTAEAAALAQAEAAQRKAAQPHLDKIAAAERLVHAVDLKLKAAQAAAVPVEKQRLARDLERKAALTAVNNLERRVEALKHRANYSQQIATIKSLTPQIAKLAAESRRTQTELAAVESQHVARLGELKKLKDQLVAAERSVSGTQTAMTNRKSAVQSLADAAAKADQAAKQLGEDKQLAAVIAGLKQKSQALRSEVAVAENTLKQQTATMDGLKKQIAAKQPAVDDGPKKLAALTAANSKAVAELTKVNEQLAAARSAADEAQAKIVEQLTGRFAAAPLQALSPEQLAWSTMQGSGYTERIRTAEIAALKKKNPKAEPSPAQVAEAVRAKLNANVAAYVKLFGSGSGQRPGEFFASVDQALFVSNGAQVRSWMRILGTDLQKQQDPNTLAEELYLSVLTRRPTAEEIADVKKYLTGRDKDRAVAIAELAWGLVASAEFRFHH